jgi:F-type H+-transporting ATPase subunit epsilon
MSPAGLTILADRAGSRDDFDSTMLAADIKDTEEDVADAKDDAQRDKLTRHFEQLKTLQAALGFGSQSSSQRPDAPH